ncbi:hypothetical protein RB623_23460 [Mesorhizobium sp. LHD-90]|uniref:hypothetical protein n=1 Tax=Mesorhizobium sp. LHD-90 TaxID=3071414 RepID=UPI0027DEB254|nr:hypothetical protein [Mesorhizobium sp. LHD-90]MDQ6437020.1 hypothetical protein [Mesorhizobium sp. LHD-90]
MLITRLATLSCLAVLASLFMAAPASALTMAECSAKYNAAKEAGTLGGMKWNDFRKAECGSDASATAEPEPAAENKDETAKGLTMAECSAKYNAAKEAGTLGGAKWNDFRKAECGPGASATAVAPAKPEKSRKAAASSETEDETAKGLTMAECSAKYNAAKEAGTLGSMKWNDFRKAECGPGASATAAAPAKAEKSRKAAASEGKGLTMAECSAKYQQAKAGGTLNGMKWNDFRKSSCGANAADDDTVPSIDEANYTSEPETPTARAPRGMKFPTAISRKFSSENPGKARMHTCLEQYYANKDADTLGGVRWIQKGGGYYSLCNARLKAATNS